MTTVLEEIIKEEWNLIGESIGSKNFEKRITGFYTITEKKPRLCFPTFVKTILDVTGMSQCHWSGGGCRWFYLVSEEILELFSHNKTIKISNRHIGDGFNDIKGECIDEVILKIKKKSYLETKEKIEKIIVSSLVDKMCGDYSFYSDADAQIILARHKVVGDEVTYVNDMVVGVPYEGNSLRLNFSCNGLDMKSGEINGNSCLLSTLWELDIDEVSRELGRHVKFDIYYDEKLKEKASEYNILYIEQEKNIKKLKTLGAKILTCDIEDEFDDNTPEEYHYLLRQARAKATLAKAKAKTLSRSDFCNICGTIELGHGQDEHENIWLLCQKHGWCHSGCNGVASLSCPHC